MTFTGLVALVARLMEGLGVLTMLLGTLLSGVSALLKWKNDGGPAAFKRLRQQVGRAILYAAGRARRQVALARHAGVALGGAMRLGGKQGTYVTVAVLRPNAAFCLI